MKYLLTLIAVSSTSFLAAGCPSGQCGYQQYQQHQQYQQRGVSPQSVRYYEDTEYYQQQRNAGNWDENRRDDRYQDNRQGGFGGRYDDRQGGVGGRYDDRQGGFGGRYDDRQGGVGGRYDDRQGGFGGRYDDRQGGFGGRYDDRQGGFGGRYDDRQGGVGGRYDDRQGGFGAHNQDNVNVNSQDTAATAQDREINNRIRERLTQWMSRRNIDDLVLKTNNGEVVVTGTVEKSEDIQKANDQIKSIEGVKRVDTQLNVKQ